MTADHTPSPLLDPREVAADARSILACPASVTLRVPGRPGIDAEDGLAMQECRGTPSFVCAPDSALAAAVGREAVVTVRSGVGPTGSARRAATVSIEGRLEARGTEACACCGDARLLVVLAPTVVTLCGDETATDPLRVRVPLEEYAADRHELNRGLLQRSAEHANDHHQDELRRSVSVATRTPISQVLGVSVAELGPAGVTIDWLDPQGAHRSTLAFPRAARTAAELGGLLRRELDTGIC